MDKIRIPLVFVNEIAYCSDYSVEKIFEYALKDGKKIFGKHISVVDIDNTLKDVIDFYYNDVETSDCIRISIDYLKDISDKSYKYHAVDTVEFKYDFEYISKGGNRLVAKVIETGYHHGSCGMFGVTPHGDHSYPIYSVDFEYNPGD